MAKKTKAEAQATRDGILNAAVEVFLAKGVARASLEDIAEKAGVTRGAVYWHFKNKHSIFQTLQEQLDCSLVQEVLEDIQKNHPEPLRQLEELCIGLLESLEHDAQKKNTLSIFFLKCDYSGDMECFLEQQNADKAKQVELFARCFARAQSMGQLDESADPKILSLSLLSYLTGIVYEYLRNTAQFNLQKQASLLIRQFFAGLR